MGVARGYEVTGLSAYPSLLWSKDGAAPPRPSSDIAEHACVNRVVSSWRMARAVVLSNHPNMNTGDRAGLSRSLTTGMRSNGGTK